jgi:hypothetical protein
MSLLGLLTCCFSLIMHPYALNHTIVEKETSIGCTLSVMDVWRALCNACVDEFIGRRGIYIGKDKNMIEFVGHLVDLSFIGNIGTTQFLCI